MKRRPLRPLLLKLFAIPIFMFGFGYLMIPLYDVFCEVTGLNGKTGRVSAAEAQILEVDTKRLIKVQFDASVNRNGAWDFRPLEKSMMVHPGKSYTTKYYAHNKLSEAVVSQSIPSIAPNRASLYFSKMECFCFTEQKFGATEAREMPLTFVVDPKLPKDVDTIILSYTLFTKK